MEVTDIVLFQCYERAVFESMHAPPMPNASEKHHLIQTVLYPMKRIHISA